MGERCCSQSCSPGATSQVEAGSIQRDEGRRKWPGQGAGGTSCVVFRDAGAALWSLESPVPPFHHTGRSSRVPPAQPGCCCCARCGAGRAQRGTAVLAPVTLGEQEPAEEPPAAGTGRATVSASPGCGTREQPGVLCQCVALPWHQLCVPCGKYRLKALPVVLGVLVAVLEGSTCHPTAAPPSRQQAGIGTAQAAGEVPGAFSRGREPLVDALAGTSRGLWGPLPVPGHRGSPRPPPAPPSPGGERAAAGYSSSRAAHGLSQRLCVGGSDE